MFKGIKKPIIYEDHLKTFGALRVHYVDTYPTNTEKEDFWDSVDKHFEASRKGLSPQEIQAHYDTQYETDQTKYGLATPLESLIAANVTIRHYNAARIGVQGLRRTAQSTNVTLSAAASHPDPVGGNA